MKPSAVATGMGLLPVANRAMAAAAIPTPLVAGVSTVADAGVPGHAIAPRQ
jgi:hypothetical protein